MDGVPAGVFAVRGRRCDLAGLVARDEGRLELWRATPEGGLLGPRLEALEPLAPDSLGARTVELATQGDRFAVCVGSQLLLGDEATVRRVELPNPSGICDAVAFDAAGQLVAGVRDAEALDPQLVRYDGDRWRRVRVTPPPRSGVAELEPDTEGGGLWVLSAETAGHGPDRSAPARTARCSRDAGPLAGDRPRHGSGAPTRPSTRARSAAAVSMSSPSTTNLRGETSRSPEAAAPFDLDRDQGDRRPPRLGSPPAPAPNRLRSDP